MSKNKDYGYVAKEILKKAKFDENGFAIVRLNEKWGFVDTTGKVVVPLEYDDVKDFKDGLAKVKKDRKWGFVDTTGKVVIPLKYDSVEDFKEGLVKVKKDGKWGYLLNNQGEIIDKCLSITISIYGDAEEQDYAYLDKNKMKECLQCIAESDDIAGVLYDYGGKNISIITGITYVGLICGKKFKDITDEDDFNEGNFVGKVKGFNTDSIDENEYGICWTNYSSIATFEYIIDDYPHKSLDEVDISQISINKDNRLSYKGKKYDLYDIDIESFNNDLCIYKGKEEIFCDDHYFHDKDNFLNFVREEFGIEVRHFNEEDDDFDEEDED